MSISKQLIIITGISGSGKTTLSKKIQKETKNPPHHINNDLVAYYRKDLSWKNLFNM